MDKKGFIKITIILIILLLGSIFVKNKTDKNIEENLFKNEFLLEDINIISYTEKYIDDYERISSIEFNKNSKNSKNTKSKPAQEIATRGEISRKPIYNINNLTIKSGVSEAHLNSKLKDTALYDYASFYIKAEEKFGINALFLCALSIQESGWGESRLTKDKNNLFGYAAYNDSPYSSAKQFSSVEECILVVGEKLAINYLGEDGKYYNGKSIDAINIRYSLNDDGTINKNWGNSIKSLMKQLSE